MIKFNVKKNQMNCILKWREYYLKKTTNSSRWVGVSGLPTWWSGGFRQMNSKSIFQRINSARRSSSSSCRPSLTLAAGGCPAASPPTIIVALTCLFTPVIRCRPSGSYPAWSVAPSCCLGLRRWSNSTVSSLPDLL